MTINEMGRHFAKAKIRLAKAVNEGIRKLNAQLRYYLHVPDPDSLTDTEWAMRIKELEWIRTEEAKANKMPKF